MKREKKRQLSSFLIAHLGKYLLRLILFTCKIQVRGLEEFHKIAAKEPTILMLWHNRLSIISEILNKIRPKYLYAAFISNSRDGEPLARLANSYPNGRAIRVPHNARGQALKGVIDNLKQGQEIIVITPDGPKGPRYEVKPGIVVAANETNAHIVPFTWSSTAFWQLKTWDKMLFPKPFSRIIVTFGSATQANAVQDSNAFSKELERSLLDLERAVNKELEVAPR